MKITDQQTSNLRGFIGNSDLSDDQVANYADIAQKLVDESTESGLFYSERTETRPPKSVLDLISTAEAAGMDIDPALLHWHRLKGLPATVVNVQSGRIKLRAAS